jgi:hypothetical protein
MTREVDFSTIQIWQGFATHPWDMDGVCIQLEAGGEGFPSGRFTYLLCNKVLKIPNRGNNQTVMEHGESSKHQKIWKEKLQDN